jgi:hypothetical protein
MVLRCVIYIVYFGTEQGVHKKMLCLSINLVEGAAMHERRSSLGLTPAAAGTTTCKKKLCAWHLIAVHAVSQALLAAASGKAYEA